MGRRQNGGKKLRCKGKIKRKRRKDAQNLIRRKL